MIEARKMSAALPSPHSWINTTDGMIQSGSVSQPGASSNAQFEESASAQWAGLAADDFADVAGDSVVAGAVSRPEARSDVQLAEEAAVGVVSCR